MSATLPIREAGKTPLSGTSPGLAISGGVDSMALALLCSQAKRAAPFLTVSDHTVNCFVAYIVDHKLRDQSHEEAVAVSANLRKLPHLDSVAVLPLNWRKALGLRSGEEFDPKTMPNVEGLARKLRYQTMARFSSMRGLNSLFVAHHEDDQYETVLMRLLGGHGTRGLRGIRPANDIPECHGIHGAYQSGFVDELARDRPYYTLGPSRIERKHMKRDLLATVDFHDIRGGLQRTDPTLSYADDDYLSSIQSSKPAPPLPPLETEDSGIMVYRPLLPFSKDRLIATCLENKIEWFEDATNKDPKLTTRNSLRHIAKNHRLPVALQKPAILQLAERCNRKAAAEEAEADRLISRTVLQEFQSSVGTVVVRLPRLAASRARKGGMYSQARVEVRSRHLRIIAALLVRKLLSLVTPEKELTAVSNLDLVVRRLFPRLFGSSHGKNADDPKGFNVCSVHWTPVKGKDGLLYWYLSRAPYTSTARPPRAIFPWFRKRVHRRLAEANASWPRWGIWRLYDGRFWVRMRSKLPVMVYAFPFHKDYAKKFRESLGEEEAQELTALLKRHAPGKVRYTLPALYAVPFDWQSADPMQWASHETQQSHAIAGAPTSEMEVIALPTLGVQLPGLGDWLHWQLRYRKVDVGMLERSASTTDEVRGTRRKMATRGANYKKSSQAGHVTARLGEMRRQRRKVDVASKPRAQIPST